MYRYLGIDATGVSTCATIYKRKGNIEQRELARDMCGRLWEINGNSSGNPIKYMEWWQ